MDSNLWESMSLRDGGTGTAKAAVAASGRSDGEDVNDRPSAASSELASPSEGMERQDVHGVDGTGNADDLDADGLSREDRRKLKKLNKKRKREELEARAVPELVVNAENYAKSKNNCLKIKDLQNIPLWILADGVNPSWLLVKHRENIRKVLVIMAPNLLPHMLLASFDQSKPLPPAVPPHAPQFTIVERIFDRVFVVKGPADKTRLVSPVASFMQLPLTQAQKIAIRREMESRKARSLADLVLTERQLVDNYYPESRTLLSTGWSHFKCPRTSTHYDYLAMDCEMVYTEKGLELARATLVDEDGTVVYDQLVLPPNPIIDYNTKFSGITEEMMCGVNKTLEEVQAELQELVHEETVLIGHSLENDLKTLRIHHRRVIDTALLYHSSRGPPSKPKLSYLVQKHLGRAIQDDAVAGHNSAEDALACMELAQLKLKNGHGFGVVVNENESIFARLSRSNKQSAIVDSARNVSQYGADAAVRRAVSTDDEAVKTTEELLADGGMHFIWLRLRALDQQTVGAVPPSLDSIGTPMSSKLSTPKDTPIQRAANQLASADTPISSPFRSAAPTPTQQLQQLSWEDQCAHFNRHLERIFNAAPVNTAILVYSGLGDVRDAAQMMARRAEYQQLCGKFGAAQVHRDMPEKVFGETETVELERALEVARMGTALLGVKKGSSE